MLLAPFLTGRDLLRLSECSAWLRPFLGHLESLHIKLPYELWKTPDVAVPTVTSILARQRRLERLKLEEDVLVLPGLMALKDGAGASASLRGLHLGTGKRHGTQLKHQSLSAALVAGACPLLERLDCCGTEIDDEGVGCLVSALRAGACRNLRSLCLQSNKFRGPGGVALASPRRSRCCP
jgi:hypothetical protein